MNFISLHWTRIVWQSLAASVALFGLCSCQEVLLTDVGPLPPHFREGTSDCDVVWRMGEPDMKYYVQNPKDPGETVGYCWHYGDNYFDEIGRTNNWGSWDLYFDLSQHLVGWQMAEPLPANYNARQAFARDISERHWEILHDERAKRKAELMRQLAEKCAKKQVAVQPHASTSTRKPDPCAKPKSSATSPSPPVVEKS